MPSLPVGNARHSFGAVMVLLSLVAGSGAADPLLSSPDPGSARMPTESSVLRSRWATVATEQIPNTANAWVASGGREAQTLTLNLYEDAQFVAVLEEVENLLPGKTSWIGHVNGVADSSVILVEGEGKVRGTIHLPDAKYLIAPEAGTHVVEEVDPTLGFEEGEPIVATEEESTPPGGIVEDSGDRIDILVVYTAAARSSAGGRSALENEIVHATSVANRTLSNSQAGTQFRLVGVQEVSYSEVAGDLLTDLARLKTIGDGHLDEVHQSRGAKGADLVHLVIEGPASQACGRAYVMDGVFHNFRRKAFGVTNRICRSSFEEIFTHELGHNLGCRHAPGDYPSPGAFPYSFGYKDPQKRFRTIMAYQCIYPGCPGILNFSSSSILHSGLPTGTPEQDNARSIQNTRTTAANFYPSVPGVCPWDVGHPRYCADCGPCGNGEGDCDGDHQCEPGMTCVEDVGPDYGFGAAIDVCVEPCPVPLGHGDYCQLCGPCSAGEGNCDPDQCEGGLVCAEDVGASYGFPAGVDVCEAAPSNVNFNLAPAADAWVAQNLPNSNFGTGQNLQVRWNNTGKARFSFLKFNVPILPGTIVSAKLRIRTGANPIAQAGFYDAEITEDWGETTITWNNWGNVAQTTYLGGLQNLVPETWYEFDVLGAVNGGGIVTLGIYSGIDQPSLDFWSRESSYPPILKVTYQQ